MQILGLETLPEFVRDKVNMLIPAIVQGIENEPCISPAFFFVRKDEPKVSLIVPDFSDQESKLKSFDVIRQLANREKVDGIIFVTESNRIPVSPEEMDRVKSQNLDAGKMFPDRKIDCLTITVETHEGHFLGFADINSVGGKRTMETLEFKKNDMAEGNATNFLDRPDNVTLH